MSGAWIDPPTATSDLVAVSDGLMEPSDYAVMLGEREFDYGHKPSRPAPILLLNGKTISTPGNITNVQAQAKAGKTSVLGGILAAVIVGEREGCDTLGFRSSNPLGGYVLHFDTEQSRFDHDSNVRLVLERAKRHGDPPPWLRSYCLTDLGFRDRYGCIMSAMELAAADPAGLFMVVIDGVADLCNDPNNAEESNYIVQVLHKAAIDYNCAVVTVLHENPGSDYGKMRGHLGSQLERKAETALRLAKDTSGVVTIWAERARHCMIPKDQGHCIRYDEEEHCFVSCGSAKELKGQEKLERYRREISEVFGDGDGLNYSNLCRMIKAVTGLKIDAAKKRVKEWGDLGLIDHIGETYCKHSSASSQVAA